MILISRKTNFLLQKRLTKKKKIFNLDDNVENKAKDPLLKKLLELLITFFLKLKNLGNKLNQKVVVQVRSAHKNKCKSVTKI